MNSKVAPRPPIEIAEAISYTAQDVGTAIGFDWNEFLEMRGKGVERPEQFADYLLTHMRKAIAAEQGIVVLKKKANQWFKKHTGDPWFAYPNRAEQQGVFSRIYLQKETGAHTYNGIHVPVETIKYMLFQGMICEIGTVQYHGVPHEAFEAIGAR